MLHHLQVATEAQARMTPAQIERTLVRVRAPDAPRIYDNLGYGLLGYVLANIAHKSYPALLADEVFAPLGMNHAGVGLSPTRMGDAAQCHELAGDGKMVAKSCSLPGELRGARQEHDKQGLVADVSAHSLS